ncbi:hypothetical protein [Frigoriglobus tundricola]|uniref:Uncharacterized protein n=1 Tax=Frigoriglobus tundricola TaxID=2774151 RepID=A0A6M5YPI5_9BACT|nr:hypothetical protein [Frigoriglobus tundricola]QJW95414.1 hypothetical protein FTUN_2963 [Frigoriglobus tundricola]
MPAVAASVVVRTILTDDINLAADEVIKRARAKGATGTDKSLRDTIYNVKSGLKKKGVKPAAVPAAAREIKAPTAPMVAATTPSSPSPDLTTMLANVALVNSVVGACGGAESTRKVAEAVRACGGVEAFLQHVDLVAGIRGPSA